VPLALSGHSFSSLTGVQAGGKILFGGALPRDASHLTFAADQRPLEQVFIQQEDFMKRIALALAFSMIAGSAYAASCAADSAEKKLAGAAKTSFMKKCETDAKASCDKQAAEKKLAGAAKTSFTKKCVTDSVSAM
jgi:hypothetical protein